MKKLIIHEGGHPLYANDHLEHLNEMIQEVQNALAQAGDLDNYYLQEPVLTEINGGNDYEWTAGSIVIDGEICLIDGGTVGLILTGTQSHAWVIVETYRSSDPLAYADSTSKNVHIIRKAELQIIEDGSEPDEYVLLDDVVSYGGAVAAILPVDKWVTASLESGWSKPSGFGYGDVKYRKDRHGMVELSGASKNSSVSTGDLIFFLPDEYRPTERRVIMTTFFNEAGDVLFEGSITIQTTGSVAVGYLDSTTNIEVHLDGLRFRI